MNILKEINSPADIKNLNIEELNILADEIRQVILKRTSEFGGHIGSNLGIIELTIAIHFCFDSPKDKIIFDVSHQSYTHKILTGRKDFFTNKDKYDDISGFTDPKESEHDIFRMGHTSTSISQALGLAIARDKNNSKENIIAIIGDGALSGGIAFEGLNNVAEYNKNLIIIVNDNEMSIAENHGGIYKNLEELRNTKGKSSNNIFKTLGIDYAYIEDGNNISSLLKTLNKYKNISHPIIIHVHTKKGKGLSYAEKEQEKFHKIKSFDIKNGQEQEISKPTTMDYVIDKLITLIEKNNKIQLITAGTPSSIGLYPNIRNKIKDNYIDVGIAEAHAISLSSGLAKNNIKPVFIVQSAFIGRAYDELVENICINNLPAVIILNKCGIMKEDATHIGYFDIPLLSNIPNIEILVPATKKELSNVLEYATNDNSHPIVIRLNEELLDNINNNEYQNKYSIIENGSKVAIIGLGNFLNKAIKVKELLSKDNINPTIINPHFVGIDEDTLNHLTKNHELIVVLEDVSTSGSLGEKIANYYSTSNVKVLTLGAQKEFPERLPKETLYKKYNLLDEQIYNLIINNIK